MGVMTAQVPADPRGGGLPGESPLPGGVQHPSALPRGPRAARLCLPPDPALAGFPWGRCAPWGVPALAAGSGAVWQAQLLESRGFGVQRTSLAPLGVVFTRTSCSRASSSLVLVTFLC